MKFKLSQPVQISLSTADDSANYFTGEVPRVHEPDLSAAMPSGPYRVVDDQLFQLVVETRRAPISDQKR